MKLLIFKRVFYYVPEALDGGGGAQPGRALPLPILITRVNEGMLSNIINRFIASFCYYYLYY